MKNIIVTGANGQVGIELCLFLNLYDDLNVIGICRSELSAIVLKKFGIKYRVGDISVLENAKTLLSDADVIVDLVIADGSINETNRISKNQIYNSIASSKTNSKYVYMSSQMVFGMNNEYKKLKYHIIPKTIYAVKKRFAEKMVLNFGKKFKRNTYIIRLGQVHGILQSVSISMKKVFKNENFIFKVPKTNSYTIFCYSISEAIYNIANDKEKPGIYTGVSFPEWSWRELFNYYSNNSIKIIEYDEHKRKKIDFLKSFLNKFIKNNIELIRANILLYLPKYENKIKFKNSINNAKSQINNLDNIISNDFDYFIGELPGKRLNSLSDSRLSIKKYNDIINNILKSKKIQ